MVFTRQKERAGANPESTARPQPGTNIREVRTTRRTVFTWEHNKLFIQKFLQYSRDEKGDEFHYLVLGLNESSTEEDMKKAYITLALRFHPDKNQLSQVPDVMKIINEAKDELENIFCRIDAIREEERVCMAYNNIMISSESFSSDDSLETSSVE